MISLKDNNIVHFDIKPPNILCSHSERKIEIINFGISEKIENHFKKIFQEGSDYFMAPELKNKSKGCNAS